MIISVLKLVKPQFGFDLYKFRFPLDSRLGGSASVCASILGCFNMFRRDQWDSHELCEIAFCRKALSGVAGGWQDQYAAVFGGFNFIEFHGTEHSASHKDKQNILMELRKALFCVFSIDHKSGDIHVNQKETMKASDVQLLVKENVELTYTIRNHLLRGD